jgi:hypothetical protein
MSPIPLQTAQDREVYLFMAIDAFSQFALNVGVFPNVEKEGILSGVNKLLRDKDFRTHSGPFTLVLPDFREITHELELLVEPEGTIVFDEEKTV